MEISQFVNRFDSEFTTLGMARQEKGYLWGTIKHSIDRNYRSSLDDKLLTKQCAVINQVATHKEASSEYTASQVLDGIREIPQELFEEATCIHSESRGEVKIGENEKFQGHSDSEEKSKSAHDDAKKEIADEFAKIQSFVQKVKDFKKAVESGKNLEPYLKDDEFMTFLLSETKTNRSPLLQICQECSSYKKLVSLMNVIGHTASEEQGPTAVKTVAHYLLAKRGDMDFKYFSKKVDVDLPLPALKELLSLGLFYEATISNVAQRVTADRKVDEEGLQLALPFESAKDYQVSVDALRSTKKVDNDLMKEVLFGGENDVWAGNDAVAELREAKFNEYVINKGRRGVNLKKLADLIRNVHPEGEGKVKTCALKIAQSICRRKIALESEDRKEVRQKVAKAMGVKGNVV